MKKSELIEYTFKNEEDLPFSERIKLSKMTKKEPDMMTLILFNKQPNFLREYEKIYFAKYLSKNCSFYEKGDDVYVAPSEASEKELSAFYIPDGCSKRRVDDLYKESGIGYRNLRVYSVLPGLKYKLIKGKGLTGYPSIDKPWATQNETYNIKQNNLLDFFNAGRNKLLADNNAFQCYDQKVTWDEFQKLVDKYTKAFAANGIGKNDVVPVCTQSIIESVALFFAADSIGAITLFIDPDNTSLNVVHKYLKNFNSKLLFTTPQYVDGLKPALADTSVNKLIVISPADELRKCEKLSEPSKEYLNKCDVKYEKSNNVITIDQFIKEGKLYKGSIEYFENNAKVSLITSTSGSTGEPKLVELTRNNIMYEMMYLKRSTHLDLGPKGINMQVVPFKYPYGFVISTLVTLYAGKTSGLCPDLTPANYLNFINMYNPKYIHAIPSFYKNMIDDPNVGDLSNLEFAVSGGDFYDAKSIEIANNFFKEHGSKAKIKNGFGSAEATACVTAATVGKYNIESVGKPLIGTNVKIVDKEGKELPYDHIGNICYSGANVMNGYNNDPDNTASVKFIENGEEWILTDAIGFVDNEGFVYVCDRERNLFITYSDTGAPFKVYPNYVQLVINSVEGVDDSIVVKATDEKRILVPSAFIAIKDGYDSNDVMRRVIEKCNQELDKCAIPVEFKLVPEIKIKESGKADIKYYEALLTEDVEKQKGAKNL